MDRKMKKVLIKSRINGRYIKSRIIIKKEQIEELPQTQLTQQQNKDDWKLDTSMAFASVKGVDDSNQNISFLEEKKKKIVMDLLQITDVMKTDENVLMINSESLTNILEKNAITVRWCKLCNLIVR